MKRLFFALWPDSPTRRALAAIARRLRGAGLRPVSPGNFHATLLYLGHVEDEVCAALRQQAGEIHAQPFTLVFDTLSFWPGPRVLCLACRRQPEAVHDLVGTLTDMVSAYSIQLDTRPYRAHVTLARKAGESVELVFEPLYWRADSFALVESRSTENGVIYQPLTHWPLG